MREKFQTRFGDGSSCQLRESGNCAAAAFATLLDTTVEAIEGVAGELTREVDFVDWLNEIERRWLHKRCEFFITIGDCGEIRRVMQKSGAWAVAIGRGKGGSTHAVVYRGGRFHHCPSGNLDDLREVFSFTMVARSDPKTTR